MPAHLTDIRIKCSEEGCGAWASHALRNTRNATMGYYCKEHGPSALTEFRKRDESGDLFGDRY